MLIDQFTPDQLEQIKKELKYLKYTQKQRITQLQDRIRKIFPFNREASDEEEALWLARVGLDNMIYEMADLTLRNVTYVDKHTSNKKKLQRGSTIPPKLQEEYLQFVDEILAAIEKHKK